MSDEREQHRGRIIAPPLTFWRGEKRMSGRHISAMLAEQERRGGDWLRPGEVAVMAALLDFYNDDAGMAWPSVDRLAKRAGCKRRHLQDILASLEQSGAITRQRRRGTTAYRFPWLPRCAPECISDVHPSAPKQVIEQVGDPDLSRSKGTQRKRQGERILRELRPVYLVDTADREEQAS